MACVHWIQDSRGFMGLTMHLSQLTCARSEFWNRWNRPSQTGRIPLPVPLLRYNCLPYLREICSNSLNGCLKPDDTEPYGCCALFCTYILVITGMDKDLIITQIIVTIYYSESGLFVKTHYCTADFGNFWIFFLLVTQVLWYCLSWDGYKVTNGHPTYIAGYLRQEYVRAWWLMTPSCYSKWCAV